MFLETQQPEQCVDVVSPRPRLVAPLLLIHPWFVFAFLVGPHSCSSSILPSTETSGYLNLSPVITFPADELPVFSRNLYNFQVPDFAFGWLNLILFCILKLSFFHIFSSVILRLTFIPQPCFLCHGKGMN